MVNSSGGIAEVHPQRLASQTLLWFQARFSRSGACQDQGHDNPNESTTINFALIRMPLLSLSTHRRLVSPETPFLSGVSRHAAEALSLVTSSLSNRLQLYKAFLAMPSI
jgi:hypothetical protein